MFDEISKIKPEPPYKNSRLDFLINNKDEEIWLETKGCTLKKGTKALFPDTPTKRGSKHIKHLIELKKQGKRAAIIFLVFVNAEYFMPNYAMDPVFSKILEKARTKGVEIFPLKFLFENDKIFYKKIIPPRFFS
ncbi:MAG: DNA/RNA nuclease SfsA [Candidatus Cloacimonetes bacterium]|nr:DNA/RNA nuclease SfsA [Candidatus Cloacimonadota bacterium]